MATRVGRRTDAASAALGSRLTKRDRQLVALIFEESARRHAKSVQVKVSHRGAVTASVYLQWPAQGMPEATATTRGDPAPACAKSAPAEAPPARPEAAPTDVPQEQGINDAGVQKFTVHEPGKAPPTSRSKTTTKPAKGKVDKNALSAKGSAQKKPPPPKPHPTPSPLPPRVNPFRTQPISAEESPIWDDLERREKARRVEAKRKSGRSGSDSPPYKSPRGSDYESGGSDMEESLGWDPWDDG